MGQPYPCCCGPVGGCDDYYTPTQWQFELTGLEANAAGYANAEVNQTVWIWWYWDAAAALTELNAFLHNFFWEVGDLEGPGLIDTTATTFAIGHRRLETLTLNVNVTLYAVDASGFPGPKPAEIAFTPYVFTLSDWAAVVRIYEQISGGPRSRSGQLSLFCNIATDPLPGTLSQLGTNPTYGFPTELAGKYHLLDLTTFQRVENCAQPIRMDLLPNQLAVNGFRYAGWQNVGTASLSTATPFVSGNATGTAVQRGALQHA